eukprot:UN00622
MGHGGQAKGVGALPVHNLMINIVNHRNVSDEMEALGDDDSVSVIYGDEDALHHKLPFYQAGRLSLSGSADAARKKMRDQIDFYINRSSGTGDDVGDNSPIVIVEDLNVVKNRKVTTSKLTVTSFGSYTDVQNIQFATPTVDDDSEIITPPNTWR